MAICHRGSAGSGIATLTCTSTGGLTFSGQSSILAFNPFRSGSPEGKKSEARSLPFCILHRRGQPTRHLFCSFDGS